MNNIFKKGISFALTLALVVTMCFGSIGTAKVHAAEEAVYPALSVYDGDTLVKEFSLEELQDIAAKEGNIKYKFSGYNRNPSFYTYGDPDNKETPSKRNVREAVGPTVAGILAEAGVTYTDEQLLTFVAPDMVKESFTAGDLFAERYYFPHGNVGTAKGAAAPEEAYADVEPVVPIIDMFRSDDYEELDGESTLRFGQLAPNEQNISAFVKYMAAGGTIIVGDAPTEKWPEISTANYSGGEILPETDITFDIPASMLGKKVAAYYTLDGTEPGYGDAIYNYDKYGGINPPVLDKVGETYTIKFKVIGYGKQDSGITTFTYTVVDPDSPAKPATLSAARAGYDSIKLTWSQVADADGYEIMKYDVDTKQFETIASVLSSQMVSYTDKGLATGTSCSYKVRAFKLLSSGQRVYGDATTAKSATPILSKPTLKSAAKTGYGGIQIKWSKVDGATGYQVWRYDAVTKKYTLVKTIASGNTVSWKNTGLKTGRKYTYKVRAYRTLEDGTKKYSAYSSTKAATPALAKPVISKVTAGKKSATVKWGKVAGANGYKIYRSTAKNGKYTLVKTIKKGGTVSWKNTGLKKGKKYYYKVKAYRIVDKKYVYSSISSSKYTKAK